MKKERYPIKKAGFLESMTSSYNFDARFFKEDKFWQKAREDYDKYFLGGSSDQNEYRIPKKIHQIWLGSPFPKKYMKWQKTWKYHHPDWEYYLWTDEEVKNLTFRNREIFEKTTNFGPKSDILRYEVLNQFGGLYIDTDFECFQAFDYLHLNMDFYSGIEYGKEFSTTTALIASVPDHKILKYLIDRIDRPLVSDDTVKIHEITGPWAFSNAYKKFMFDNTNRNVAMPTSYFYSFPNNKLHITKEKKIKKFVKPESMAMHYWEVSWTRKTDKLSRLRSRLLRYIPSSTKKKIKDFLGM